MKTVLTLGASLVALCAVSMGPAAAQWRHDDGYSPSHANCRIIREWRHGEMRTTRICRPRVSARYYERRYVRPDWDRRHYDDDNDYRRGGGNGNYNGNGNLGDNNGNYNGNYND
jgi:hypothetical protein